jgi:hypothetical protein
MGDLRHTLSVSEVETALTSADVPRSRRQVIRYCETGMLDAVKVPGPSGDQWYVSPASIPKVIGDLKQWEAQRAGHGAPRRAAAPPVAVENQPSFSPDTASHGAPGPAVSDEQLSQEKTETKVVVPRQGLTELDVYGHPYVKRLEAQLDKLEVRLEAQVRRTEEIQTRSQDALIELQRMVAVGQSQTLADFMLKAREWVLGKGNDQNSGEQPAAGQEH